MTITAPSFLVAVTIPTAELHDANARVTAYQTAVQKADADRQDVLGDHHTGPRIRGRLTSSSVELVWRTTPRLNPRPAGATT